MFEEQMEEIAKNITKEATDIFRSITPIDVIKGALFIISIATRNNNGTE